MGKFTFSVKSYEDKFQELIDTSNYEDFVSELKVSCNDPKIQALIDEFLKTGERLYSRRQVFDVSKLCPTQKEIDCSKSLSWPLTHIESDEQFFSNKPIVIKLPVIIYDGKYIIDGHHRWSQVYCINPKAKMDCIDLLSKEATPEDILRITQLKIAHDLKDVAVKKVEGVNLIDASLNDVKKFIENNITSEVEGYLIDQYKVKDRDGVVKQIIKNIEQMRRTSRPIKDAPERGYMPQTDMLPDFDKSVKSKELPANYDK